MSGENYWEFDSRPCDIRGVFKPSPETARAISTITEYSEAKHLLDQLELEELILAAGYLEKLIESRPK